MEWDGPVHALTNPTCVVWLCHSVPVGTVGPLSYNRHSNYTPRGYRGCFTVYSESECTAYRDYRYITTHFCTRLVATAVACYGDKSSALKHVGWEHKNTVPSVGPVEAGEITEEMAYWEATEEAGTKAKNS